MQFSIIAFIAFAAAAIAAPMPAPVPAPAPASLELIHFAPSGKPHFRIGTVVLPKRAQGQGQNHDTNDIPDTTPTRGVNGDIVPY